MDDSVDCRITEMNLDVAGGTEGDIDVTVRISSSPDGLSPGDPEYTPHIYYIIIMLTRNPNFFSILSSFPVPSTRTPTRGLFPDFFGVAYGCTLLVTIMLSPLFLPIHPSTHSTMKARSCLRWKSQ